MTFYISALEIRLLTYLLIYVHVDCSIIGPVVMTKFPIVRLSHVNATFNGILLSPVQSTLSQKSATVAEFGDSLTFLRQCGQGFREHVLVLRPFKTTFGAPGLCLDLKN